MANPSPALRASQTAIRALRSSTASRPFLQPTSTPYTTTSTRLLQQRSNYLPSISILNNNASFPPPIRRPTTPKREIHTTTTLQRKPLAHNKEEVPDQPPPTDFGQMDVLGQTPVPTTAVEICHEDGFELNSGVLITGGSGVLCVGGEAFVWRPWEGNGNGGGNGKGKGRRLINEKGQWEVGEEAWGVLRLVWPRPGTSPHIYLLFPVDTFEWSLDGLPELLLMDAVCYSEKLVTGCC
jgi:hypothetical protein